MKYYHANTYWGDAFSTVLPTRFLPTEILNDCFDSTRCWDAPNPDDDRDFRNILEEEGLTTEEWIKKQTEDLW